MNPADFHESLRKAKASLESRLRYEPPARLPKALRGALVLMAVGFIGLGTASFIVQSPEPALLVVAGNAFSVLLGAVFLVISFLELRDFLDQRADAKYFIGSNGRLLPKSYAT